MDFYSVWPYFIIIIFLLCIANSRLLNSIDNPQDGNLTRVQTLDGLRGFLAFGVFFHHVAFYHQHVTYGGWLPPPSRFFVNLGQTSVAMFFMITGYLFWTQALQARGKLDLLKLYVGRVFRIVPLYTVLAVIVLVNAGVMTEWRLQVSPFDLVIGIMKWLAGGLFSGVPVNGYHDTGAMAGVTWTLRYEWEFYASLVLTSLFARKMFLGLLFPAAAATIAIPLSLIYPDNLGLAIILLFCIGMLVASLKQAHLQMPFHLSQHFCSFAAVVAKIGRASCRERV